MEPEGSFQDKNVFSFVKELKFSNFWSHEHFVNYVR